jgi:hypothetical protein
LNPKFTVIAAAIGCGHKTRHGASDLPGGAYIAQNAEQAMNISFPVVRDLEAEGGKYAFWGTVQTERQYHNYAYKPTSEEYLRRPSS